MAIKIIQDKTSKKKKTVKKITKKKSKNSYTTRHTDMAMPYGTISLSGRTNRKKKSSGKFFRKVVMLMFVVCLAFSSVRFLHSFITSLNKLIFLGNNEIFRIDEFQLYTSIEMPNNDLFLLFLNCIKSKRTPL